MGDFGVVATEVRMDWGQLIRRKNSLLDDLRARTTTSLEKQGIEIVRERVHFESPHTVSATGRTLDAKKIIVATGSKPLRPAISGMEHAIGTTALLSLERIPERLVVIGGGVIGLEFASIFGRVGSDVTVLEKATHILGDVDEDLRSWIEQAAPSWNVEIRASTNVMAIERANAGVVVRARVGGEEKAFDADVVLLAAGRAPQVDSLGLEKIGVRVGARGIEVNDYLETDVSGIYAIGDVHGRFRLTPVANYEARLAVRNALEGNSEKVDYRAVPLTIFTIPAASTVGLTAKEARARGIEVVTSRFAFAHLSPAIISGRTEGFSKVVFDAKSGELLGAQVIGEESEEIIHEATLALAHRLTREQILKLIPIHPTLSEGFLQAVASARVPREARGGARAA